MKKYLLSLFVALGCAASVNAQQFQVVKNGKVIKTWTINQVDKVMMVEGTTQPVIQLMKDGNIVKKYNRTQADKIVVKKGINVTGITDIPATQEMYLGMTKTFTPTIVPANASDKNLVWTSSDPEKVMVSQNGKIAAIREGVATIRVTADDGSEVYAECEVTVVNTISCITLDKTFQVLTLGGAADLATTQINATIKHGNSGMAVVWSSSDEDVATVDQTGKVTAKKAGLATITCASSDADHPEKATCTIYVMQLVTSITLSQTDAQVAPGTNFELFTEVLPADAHDKSVTWTSSDNNIATVNPKTGVVRAVAPGTATITATANDGSGVTATCTLSIGTPVTSITLNQTSAALKLGGTDSEKTTTLSVTSILPDDASDKTYTWSSSNTAVATVDASGVVTAVKAGTATIKATANDGSEVNGACTVTVTQYATSVSLDCKTATLTLGSTEAEKTTTLTATVGPDDATDKTVEWTSSDEDVATVADGVVTAKKAGEAIITVKTKDGSGKTATCTVTVKQLATSLTLDKTTDNVYAGETTTLTPTVGPSDASDKTLTWTSSDTNVATVADGVVTGVKAGTATITAKANDGSGMTATCTVTVKQYVTSVSLNCTTATLTLGSTEAEKTTTLTATVGPDDATDKTVEWTSSDEDVATVADGVVTAKKAGEVTITVKTKDGSGKTATCTVTVKQLITSLTLANTSVNKDSKNTITATINPADATDKTLKWTSSDTSIATVDETTGEVTGVAIGEVTIKAEAQDGSGKSATCKVTVSDGNKGTTQQYGNGSTSGWEWQ